MASDKTDVILYLFDKYWDPVGRRLTKTLMSLQDVAEAIRACNVQDGKARSDRNPANFLKDVIRSRRASRIWPQEVALLRFTGEQRTGTGDSFEFVPYAVGQDEPFPDLYRATHETKNIDMQSVSMSLASRDLGRSDEAWLIQTAVNLRVIEQHMATVSALQVKEVTHLQMTVKLRTTEIDALYLANTKEFSKVLITCEAKNGSERILTGQIISQVKAAFETTDAELVVPVAIRSEKGVGIHVMEFKHVSRDLLARFAELELASDALYRLVPAVRGI
ncbi:hypothetical protein ABFO19_03100 [Xanthomonas citri pv. glycines]|uniref:Restriction endonuclease n=1 Tax=Xanthomonas campestris pv. glycines TaxID=473421 RepID=A0AAX0HUQ5_XANCG|nr:MULTISPECIES: hypothetical protein [Xanthomonas]AOY64487.1 hypothetical protein BHE84_21585 [Xanthomonas citri pv. glycines str. 8ra]ARV21628.1 hypothetical protein A9D66_03150 [Xanthomonas citri pv. glycines str. 12-2]OEY88330.1 hypothetical protein BIY41_03105 [Xanthomonas citri pv. glycines]OOX00998.1 hypothetical protein Xgly_02115 [Xanthomonas citri pv. glycines]QDR43842.1 hypothetical protein FPK90_03280 [Xanthomonas citri pv. glycines]